MDFDISVSRVTDVFIAAARSIVRPTRRGGGVADACRRKRVGGTAHWRIQGPIRSMARPIRSVSGICPLGWYLLGGVGGHVLITEFHDMALNGIFCAGVLRPLDLVPLTDFTNKYYPGALPSWQSITCKEELNLLSPDMFHQ